MRRLIAEWEEQRMVQLTWPHEGTDWNYILGDAEDVFVRIAREIMRFEKLVVVARDGGHIREVLGETEHAPSLQGVAKETEHAPSVQGVARETEHAPSVLEIESNDTWARDHGGISVEEDGRVKVLDFCFNGWGMKFAADKDNLITEKMAELGMFERVNCRDFVLEGGSIESDGKGTLMTTSRCLLSPNRNAALNRLGVEERLKREFGVKRVLWLEHGAMEGDDTDSHIDTLARLAPGRRIIFQGCQDEGDSHYEEMQAMKRELEGFEGYRLVELPMPEAQYEEGQRLPATYANYLVINGAVLVPTYGCEADEVAMKRIGEVFEGREIVGVDCRTLIRQHGSLHCVTMQYYDR